MAKRILPVLALAALLPGCAMAASPVNGAWYTSVKWGMEMPDGPKGSKTGVAECTSALGLIASGDASVEAAMKEGGITKVHTVSHESYSLLGLFARFTTRVTGE
jgi:hypothetical protein